jgi:NAD(P)-dependent dehydrogenase (short-subunit alcohol dehydrogenase family)
MAETILITGSNRGIGLELCKQYAEAGWQVHACCRQPENASALSQLASENSRVTVHALDVSNEQQISELAQSLNSVSIDILLNNAGVYGQGDAYFGNADVDQWLDCFRINTIAPLKIMEAFVNHIAASKHKTIATMSSKMGSMADNGSGGSYVYRSSKAAINAVMTSAAIDLKPKNIKVAILHPGWVKTDMGGPNAEISTGQCVTQVRQILENLTLESSGGFFDIDGSVIPW